MAGDGRRARLRQGWSDLPEDILDIVYHGYCSSSPYDQAHFAAVCSSWRAVASSHPKLPALPLLLPLTRGAQHARAYSLEDDGRVRAYSLEDGRALRVPLPGYPWGRLVGSYDGGWVVCVTVGQRLLIVNVFSGARVPLSLQQSIIGYKKHPEVADRFAALTPVAKIICSEDPSSSDCVLAAIIRSARCNIALCKVGCSDGGWTTGESNTNTYEQLTDIAFCNGKLYGLAYRNLYKFDIDMNENGAPKVTSVHRINIVRGILHVYWGDSQEKYIFQLHGKLAIAMTFWRWSDCRKTPFFRVFGLVDSGCTWVEVTNLGEHALFLGQAFCKAVHVPMIGGRSTVERNHIYCFEQRLGSHHKTKCLKRLDLDSYTVYHEKNEGVDPFQSIVSCRYHYGHEDDRTDCIWVLPPLL